MTFIKEALNDGSKETELTNIIESFHDVIETQNKSIDIIEEQHTNKSSRHDFSERVAVFEKYPRKQYLMLLNFNNFAYLLPLSSSFR